MALDNHPAPVRRAGAIGIVELTDRGEPSFCELRHIRTHRITDKGGRYRWYNGYALPERYDSGSVTVRLHGTQEDTARRFNRTDNVRVIPPSDPYFPYLYARRNDAGRSTGGWWTRCTWGGPTAWPNGQRLIR